ncbi:MAG: tRNA uridine-5-carboxymethylaminomethyl(34) synthesis GTPase MnmE [Lachnospiraceae bacterium]|nr:tRNA uridine-5-carboxymethylaminomethyl(34) synthesis GTPase MnmE [Lachnospiraceae bacterium]
MSKDTIAAIASGMTHGGIGVIRVSGNDAIPIVDTVFKAKKSGKKLSNEETYTCHYGYIYDGEEKIDEVIVLLMKAPRSYTAEDTVEIDCHGGILVMRKILDILVKHGARPAEPGEFTKRAFLNGRIDLSQAESVMDVISAQNEFALKSSMNQLNGNLSNEVKELREKILHETAFIEAALDDPEHYDLDGYSEKLQVVVDELLDRMNHLLETSDNGQMLKEGIHTIIVGKPNSGKSSLMNVLLGNDRAIVTDIAGTTRDVLEEHLNLDGIQLNVVDTAGIRSTEDVIEKIGVDRARDYVTRADLILYVVDSSRALDEDDDEIIEMIKDKNVIVILNKTDLDPVISKEDLEMKIDAPIILISAKEQSGLENLKNKIKDLFFHGELSYNDEVYLTNARHKSAFINSVESLKLVKQSIEDLVPEDFYTVDLLNAYEQLGLVIGESVTDDLVDKIFHEFCMGK